MTTDEKIGALTDRIDALTQSVELLASLHKDNETRLSRIEERGARLDSAIAAGLVAFLEEWRRDGEA